MQLFTSLDPTNVIDQRLVEMYNDVIKHVVPGSAQNYYPILRRKINVTSNLVLEGTFRTSYPTADGPLCYITVGKNNNVISPFDGLGFAWKTGSASSGSAPNVFLVYNSYDSEDTLNVGTQQVIFNNGLINFLTATSLSINADTDYSYRLEITDDYSLKLWLTVGIVPPSNDGSYLLAATLPKPATTVDDFQLGDYFGISVIGTSGYEWFFDNIKISKKSGVCPVVLFKLNIPTDQLGIDANAVIDYYGGVTDSGTDPAEGLALCIYNNTTGSWDLLDIKNAASDASLDEKHFQIDLTLSEDYRDTDSNVNLLSVSTTTNTAAPIVKSHYISITDKQTTTINTGGKVDAYVNDVDSIVYAKIPCSVSAEETSKYLLNTAHGFSAGIIDVVSVSYNTGEELVSGTDWNLLTDDANICYSSTEAPYLSFANGVQGSIKVGVYTWNNAEVMQSYVDSAAVKLVGTDTLVKHYAPALAWIGTTDYPITYKSNTLTLDAAKNLLASYVKNNKSISLYGIVNELSKASAYFVDITNVNLRIKTYNHKRKVIFNEFVQTYDLPTDANNFLFSAPELISIEKI